MIAAQDDGHIRQRGHRLADGCEVAGLVSHPHVAQVANAHLCQARAVLAERRRVL